MPHSERTFEALPYDAKQYVAGTYPGEMVRHRIAAIDEQIKSHDKAIHHRDVEIEAAKRKKAASIRRRGELKAERHRMVVALGALDA